MLAATAVLLIAVLLQSLSGPLMLLFGSRPDIPLIVVVAWAMLRGSTEGAIVGFIGGVLLDSVSYTPFGLNGALLGILGYSTGLVETGLYRGNMPIFLAAGALATLVYHAAEFLGLQAFRVPMPPLETLAQLAIPAAVANAVLLLPVFLLCRRVVRALTGWRELQV